tara:strand:- start:1410 stop:2222 length:813 start_codon:yes stop_codon:yes gene_type:complete
MNNEIADLFKKHGSDKLAHNYTDIYFSYFKELKDQKLNILEIGVADGKSIKAWSEYFSKSNIVGIDINKIDLDQKGLKKENIFIHEGSQSDANFIKGIISKYEKFDIIIDDGSHLPKDVIKSFNLLFPSLDSNGLYFVEDIQTSYIHFFHGNPFDLKYSKTHMNFFKHLTDSLNYQEIANPFYRKKMYDSKITNISFYHNMVVVKKGPNNQESNLIMNHSYEDKRYLTRLNQKGSENKLKYYIKYKILYKLYTFFLFFVNLIKKIVLLRF